jgi:hypothetical protein
LPLSGKIYNELGQSVGLVQKFDIEADIRLEHLAKGIYVLVLEGDSKVFTQKLIKE